MVVPPRFVLDASFALPWIFQDEDNARSRGAWKALVAQEAVALVPAIWLWEITNVLVQSEKQSRVTAGQVSSFMALIEEMPIKVIPAIPASVFAGEPPLLRKYDLSAYDTAYLAAALNQGVPLATLNKSLRRSAKALGLEAFNG